MDRCSQCPGVYKCLPADGPRGDALFIAEAPGKDEERLERILVGKAGRETSEHYLPLAGLRRDRCRLINTVACWPATPAHKLDPKNAKHRALVACCAEAHLHPEIGESRPKLLVPMGAIACQAVDPAIDLELHHGIPIETQWGIPAFPMYHPALGMHNPKKMLHIRTDWIRLRSYLRGQLPVAVDEYPKVDYAEVTDAGELAELDPTLPMACDTESSRAQGPYCLTFSQRAGVGRLIRADRPDLLDAFQGVLEQWETDIWFHNWFYDAPIVAGMGLRFPLRRIRDTMLLAYHLGNLPQGLKVLAYRLLGMVMQDFDDLVRPYSIPKVLDYYSLAQSFDWPKPVERLEIDSKTGLWKLKKPHGMNTKLKRFFTDFSKNEAKDVFNMWEENWTAEQGMIEAQCGPWPGIDIAHVSFEESLFYACRDSDAVMRLVPILLAMRERVRDYPQEEWRAA